MSYNTAVIVALKVAGIYCLVIAFCSLTSLFVTGLQVDSDFSLSIAASRYFGIFYFAIGIICLIAARAGKFAGSGPQNAAWFSLGLAVLGVWFLLSIIPVLIAWLGAAFADTQMEMKTESAPGFESIFYALTMAVAGLVLMLWSKMVHRGVENEAV